MTNLTDKWKKGELNRNKVYYYETPFNTADTASGYWLCNHCDTEKDKIEILGEVPSYEKYQQLLSDQLAKNEGVEINAELEAENTKLKELLKECELWFTGVVGNMNDKNVGEHNRNLPIGNFEHIFKVFSQKINQVLGEE